MKKYINPTHQLIADHFHVPLGKVWKGNCDLGGGIWQKNWVVNLPDGLIILGRDSTEVKAKLKGIK